MKFLLIALLCLVALPGAFAAEPTASQSPTFPRAIASYQDDALPGLFAKLRHRVKAEPFNAIATFLFLGAIAHTFLASRFMAISHRYQHQFEALGDAPTEATHDDELERDRLQFRAEFYHFLGEVEVVFGIWAIPLAMAIVFLKDWNTMLHYVAETSFAEPVFVVVVMAIAASRPVLRVAEAFLARLAKIGGGTVAAWWFAILTAGPLLGSFITEPAAMTICALLLSRRFYELQPSMRLRYATLGLLFVNISVGGTLTHFAAPPVVMIAHTWDWGFVHMATHFGWKAVVGIVAANIVYFLAFRRELVALRAPAQTTAPQHRPIPFGIVATHLLFIGWTVFTAHYPALVISGFLFFLAFVEATERHQSTINLRSPMLVGFFLAALVVHGGCQQWWIAPVLISLTKWPLAICATLLTAVNDNAAITYLASLVPGFSDELKFAVVAGAVTGGGLTVIANAPNPAGQAILQDCFGEDGISPLSLFLAALVPTVIVGAALMLLP